MLWFAGLLLVGWLGSSLLVTWYLTRRPHDMHAEPVPADAGIPIESIRLSTADAEQIGGWYVPPTSRQVTFLLLHGVGETRSRHLWFMQQLAGKGYGVLAITMRAHGDSTGTFNDFGMGARHDVVAAVDFLQGRSPTTPIVICGTSMGGAAAVYAAKELGDRVSAYVLESVYTDLKTATWNRLDYALPPPADRMAYAGMLIWSPVILPQAMSQYSPLDHLADIPLSTPVFIIAADNDGYARPDETRALFSKVQTHGELIFFRGDKHEDLIYRDHEKYLAILDRAAAPR